MLSSDHFSHFIPPFKCRWSILAFRIDKISPKGWKSMYRMGFLCRKFGYWKKVRSRILLYERQQGSYGPILLCNEYSYIGNFLRTHIYTNISHAAMNQFGNSSKYHLGAIRWRFKLLFRGPFIRWPSINPGNGWINELYGFNCGWVGNGRPEGRVSISWSVLKLGHIDFNGFDISHEMDRY